MTISSVDFGISDSFSDNKLTLTIKHKINKQKYKKATIKNMKLRFFLHVLSYLSPPYKNSIINCDSV